MNTPNNTRSVVEQFDITLRHHGHAIAVEGEEGRLTYTELNERAERLRSLLDARGVRPDDRIFHFGERGLNFPVAVLAALRARIVWVPLENDATIERQRIVVEGATGNVALVMSSRAERRAADLGLHAVRVDLVEASLPQHQAPLPHPNDPAYITFTSGTTGAPKGVLSSHTSLAQLAKRLHDRLAITAQDRVLQFHSATVDISLEEIVVAWHAGARIITIPDSLRTDLVSFNAHLYRFGVTVVDIPTSMWLVWLEAIERGELTPPPSHLRVVGVGSEPVPNDAIDRWLTACGTGPALYGLYGSTETGITTHAAGPFLNGLADDSGTPIGLPMAGVVSHVLHSDLRPVTLGDQGQLFIRADVAALGYDDAPAATARVFVPDPFARAPGTRMYATGDRVSEAADGSLVYHGRIDSTMFINGFSVRPESVAQMIKQVPGVASSRVHVTRSRGVATLVADIVPDSDVRSGEWKEVYQALYAADSTEYPPGSNAASWLSAVDGRPVPIETMATWRDAIVAKIIAFSPRRVLELGCGTGMVLHGLLDQVERYVGVDFVPEVLDVLREQVDQRGSSTSVDLIEADLHDALGLIEESFDTVIINSVVQHFTSDVELTRVLNLVARLLAPGGRVVVGDVRNLDLEEEYRRWLASHETYSAQGGRTGDEIELLLSPGWFHNLDLLGTRRIAVRTTSKYVDDENEMSLFRFDAVLHFDVVDAVGGLHREVDGGRTSPDAVAAVVGPGEPLVARAVSRAPGLAWWRARLQAAGVSMEAAPHPTSADDVDIVIFDETDRACAEAALASVVSSYALPRTANEPRVAQDDELVRRVAGHVRATLALHEQPSIYRVDRDGRKVAVRIAPSAAVPADDAHASASLLSTALESDIADVWFDVLGQRPAPADNFFDLGGNSLNLARVLVRLRNLYDTDLSAEQFFAAPTVQGTAVLLGGGRTPSGRSSSLSQDEVAASAPVLPPSSDTAGPASFAQERLWLLSQLNPESRAYHAPFLFDVVGTVDDQALQQAAAAVAETHPVLRTALVLDGNLLMQSPAGQAPRVTVLTGDEPVQAGVLTAEERKFVEAPFDLATGEVLRIGLRRLDVDRSRLVFAVHHVAVDELSLPVLFEDFSTAYIDATQARVPSLDAPQVRYLDVAMHERSVSAAQQRERSREFWRQHLDGAPTQTDLPLDRLRPRTTQGAGRRELLTLTPEFLARADAAARREGLSTYQWWFGMFSLFLARETGARDVVVGAPSANRIHLGADRVVGFFVNTLPVRSQLRSNPTVSDHLAATGRNLLAAQRHESVPLQEIFSDLEVPRDGDTNPLFQTMVVLEPAEPLEMALGDSSAVAHDITETTSTMDLSLVVRPSAVDPQLHLVHNPEVISSEEARRMAATFEALVTAVLLDPERRCDDAVPLPPGLESVLSGEHAEVPDLRLCESFLATAERHPERTAVISQGNEITYAQLRDRVALLVEQLTSVGPVPAFVPLVLAGSVELVTAMLAVNILGSAFVPLSVDWPAARLKRALTTLDSAVVLVGQQLPEAVREHEGLLTVQTHAPNAPAPSLTSVGLDEPMYAMFTSGSTGEPKAAVVTHRGVVNRVEWMNDELGTSAAARVLQSTAPQYDSMVWELLWPLTVGGATVLSEPEMQARPDAFCAFVAEQQITTIDLVPGVLRGILEYVAQRPERTGALRSLQVAVVGGEELTEDVASLVAQLGLRARFLNLYGPTEASIGSVAHEIEPGSLGRVPIGRPIANTSALVLDDQFQPVPRGVRGELVLGGACVGLGYLGDRPRTRARFIDLPGHGRVYRTGDRSRVRSDGTLEFLGRSDDQLSINGVRVETGEIVRALNGIDGVASSGVTSVAVPGDIRRRLMDRVRSNGSVPALTAKLQTILDRVEQNR